MADQTQPLRQGFVGRVILHSPSRKTTDFKLVWDLKKEELCLNGTANLATLESPELLKNYVQTAWLLQALLEFQDLQPVTVTLATPLPNNSKYFFFEALSAMREAVLGGCNASFHASFALLRTVIELILFHLWWQERLDRNDREWSTFHAWVRGDWSAPPLKNVLRDVYARLKLPPKATGQAQLEHYYEILCRYAHKPLIRESLTYLRGSNAGASSPTVLGFWLGILNGVAKVILDLMIAEKPISLFPVEVYRKYGFNYPIGLFFDEFNAVPLTHALGEQRLSEYRSFYGSFPEVQSLLSHFNDQRSMNDDEILQTSKRTEFAKERNMNMSSSEQIIHLWAAVKAEGRALHWLFAYGEFADMQFPSV